MSAVPWKDLALDRVLDFVVLKSENETFFGTDVREWATKNGLPEPSDTRAWGSVMKNAERAGLVEHAGYGLSPSPASHKTPCSMWRRAA
ncbi:hypothetical protein [Sphingomonas sp. ACRSK]|uniref:hypothetical protein n=1 Tax=Sphingomonas sp. ACRSK TaxID=2918213 RepID=UPI001EF3D96B|nr:hypothetical protein [Sphingomonas sp. ACRSK]MCG7348812.1 hypothetical protein [Sphingomonas sp. ACRSK]